MKEIKCENSECKNKFTPVRTDQIYCDIRCRYAANNRKAKDLNIKIKPLKEAILKRIKA